MARIKVRFKGIADRRIITKKDFESVGVNYDGNDLVWDRSNNFAVTLDANEDMERVFRDQGHFTISAVTDDGGENLESDASDPNRVGNKVVDARTGAESDVPSGGGPSEATSPDTVGTTGSSTAGTTSGTTGSTGSGRSTRTS